MEMSLAYMQETAAALATRGYDLATEAHTYGVVDGRPCEATRFVLRRAEEHLVLETVRHPTEGERYFLELVQFHGLRSPSFVLDSWKHRPDRVEFKYYAPVETAMGLTLVLTLPPRAS